MNLSENVVKLRRYSESLKLEVLEVLSKGDISLTELSHKYNIPVSTIATWSRASKSVSQLKENTIKGRIYMGAQYKFPFLIHFH